MKLSGSEVLFPEYATPSEASANSPRGSVLICANPVFVLIPPRRPRPVSVVQHPAFVDAPSPQFRKDLRYPQKPSSGRWLRRGQRFFRNWGPNVGNAGSWGQDAIRNIIGTAGLFKSLSNNENRFSGALTLLETTGGSNDSDGSGPAALSFDASLVVPTGPQNVPQHIWQPVMLYLGRPA